MRVASSLLSVSLLVGIANPALAIDPSILAPISANDGAAVDRTNLEGNRGNRPLTQADIQAHKDEVANGPSQTVSVDNKPMFGNGEKPNFYKNAAGDVKAGGFGIVKTLTPEGRDQIVSMILPKATQEASKGTVGRGAAAGEVNALVQIAAKELLEGKTGTPAQAVVLLAAAADQKSGVRTAAVAVGELISAAGSGELSGGQRAEARGILDGSSINFTIHEHGGVTGFTGSVVPSKVEPSSLGTPAAPLDTPVIAIRPVENSPTTTAPSATAGNGPTTGGFDAANTMPLPTRTELVNLILPTAKVEAAQGTYLGGNGAKSVNTLVQVAAQEMLEGKTNTPSQQVVHQAAAVDREMGVTTAATTVSDLLTAQQSAPLTDGQVAQATNLISGSAINFTTNANGGVGHLVGAVVPTNGVNTATAFEANKGPAAGKNPAQAVLGGAAGAATVSDVANSPEDQKHAEKINAATGGSPMGYFTPENSKTRWIDSINFDKAAGPAAGVMAASNSKFVKTVITNYIDLKGPEAAGKDVKELHGYGKTPREIANILNWEIKRLTIGGGG